ncbi:MAG: FAD-dependent oxidoreductase [Betaproteobacteria bacterium]|nr:FAD-dependent oxidoreductase [Betaproteobacteria bacterium]
MRLFFIFSGGKDGLVSWDIHGQTFDRVVIARQPSEAARLVKHSSFAVLPRAHDWLTKAQRIQFSAITTVYLQAPHHSAPTTPCWHESGPGMPAQFVFDRGQLGDRPGLLAFVVSASHGERDQLEEEVQAQAIAQLGLGITQVVQTVIEKRATFACTPGLQRPPMRIADGILACGDYIDGPYPATLEGAVISGIQAAEALW